MADSRGRRRALDIAEMVVGRLEREAEDRVNKRLIVENRWIEDIRQYEGEYSPDETAKLSAGNRSAAFVNETRPKVTALESKLSDLLFPTDDKNWGIQPTPVPELSSELNRALEEADALTEEANAAGEEMVSEEYAGRAQMAAEAAKHLQNEMDVAKQAAELMTDEIADHLVECDWQAECRDVIHDACILGTGVLKGPLARSERIRRNWLKNEKGEYDLQFSEGADRLVFQRVSPWNLFPDSEALNFADSERWFERHLLKQKDLRQLAHLPYTNISALEELLEEGPMGELPNYVRQMQAIANEQEDSNNERYLFWEYRGPLDRDEMEALCHVCGMAEDIKEISPLFTMDCVVWFCQGRAVRFALNHLDSNAPMYSFFNLERNETRMWGVGIPWLMRHPQSIINSAWRTMLDNAAMSAFPQTEVDTSVIEPVEGDDYGIRVRKVWLRQPNSDPNALGIKFHQIPSVQSDMAAIIQMSKQFIDHETSISVLASGEQGGTTQTASGMTILMNATNVVFRRIIKNFDDGIVEPSIERAYDYLMHFSPKEEIKGDYQVQARGSSVLLVREIQAQNLMLLVMQALPHPILGQYFKAGPLISKMLQSMMIAEADVMKTAEEIAEEQAQEAQGGEPDIATMKLQLEGELAHAKFQGEMELARLHQETEMIKLAAAQEIKLEEIAAKLQAIREQTASKERIFAGEAAMSTPGQPQGGGYL